MSAKPLFYPQETDYSCAAACFRMVLSALGVTKSEDELRSLLDTTIFGTKALNVVEAARTLGFSQSSKNNLDFQELLLTLSQGFLPIVYIMTRQEHSVVVIAADDQGVTILDPMRGEITHSVEEFNVMWRRMRGLTILIS